MILKNKLKKKFLEVQIDKLDLSHIDYYDSLTPKQVENALWKAIERIAKNDTTKV